MRAYLGIVAVMVLAGGLTACSSTKQHPVSDSLAAVEIKGSTTLDIARAISETFQKAGFTPVPVSTGRDTRMVFERAGSTKDAVVYGDWSFSKLWYRAKLRFASSGPDTQLITCDAYRVYNHGEPHFEEEVKLTRMKKGLYQDLLDEAKAKLGQ